VYSVHVNYHHKKEWIRKIFCPEQSKSRSIPFFFFLEEVYYLSIMHMAA
jgi:hypothetical protein